MTHDEFHRICLMLANRTYIRYWNYWNYPQIPQHMAVGFISEPSDTLKAELEELGFFHESFLSTKDIFLVEKTEEES